MADVRRPKAPVQDVLHNVRKVDWRRNLPKRYPPGWVWYSVTAALMTMGFVRQQKGNKRRRWVHITLDRKPQL